jgi:hypothetical protein
MINYYFFFSKGVSLLLFSISSLVFDLADQ